jgi:hypothetical protein
MARAFTKLVGLTINVPEKAKATLDRQANERGVSSSLWVGQVFDMGFAAVCAREKSMPISDGDLDAITGATLLLQSTGWKLGDIATGLGVPEATVKRILDGWKQYRRGMPRAQP